MNEKFKFYKNRTTQLDLGNVVDCSEKDSAKVVKCIEIYENSHKH